MLKAEKLRPCPLCGSTDIACFAEECGDDYDNEPVYRAVVGCCGCREEGCDPSYDEEPCFGIEAYFRGDHPLIKDEEDPEDCRRVLERHMAERWNRRAERTCHVERVSTPYHGGPPRCSACMMPLEPLVNYCPYCGARVVTP